MDNLLQTCIFFIEKHKLCAREDRILLTVSGGIDSMVMSDLMIRLGYKTAIAHCNFSLRGKESDGDETFVRSWAAKNDLPFYYTRFNTTTYAEERGISIQMAARDLRYQWFHSLQKEEGFDFIALGHNKNDLVETLLINLTRGTGIRGLTGIKPCNGEIIRPILFATREAIQNYAEHYGIKWREDSSNQTTKYTRNKIRHIIIPAFEEINPDFIQGIADTADRLSGIEEIFSHYMEETHNKFLIQERNRQIIPIEKLQKTGAREAILYELLRPLGFSPGIIREILTTLNSTPGKQFFSPSHRLIKDRKHLIITPLPIEDASKRYYIEMGQSRIAKPVEIHLKNYSRTSSFHIPSSRNIAILDREKITWPLILRRWQQGDFFMPLGMQDIKKLSDFFIDQKLSLDEKENTWLLTEGEQIVWILGMRIDDRYKVTDKTREILQIEWIP